MKVRSTPRCGLDVKTHVPLGKWHLLQEPPKRREVSETSRSSRPRLKTLWFCTIRSGPYTKPYAVSTWIGSLADNKEAFFKVVSEKCTFELIQI